MPYARRDFMTLVGASLTAVCATPVLAQTKLPPNIKLVVGYSPGGAADSLARIISLGLQERLNTTVIVDNRPGAGGRVAAAQMKREPFDGSEVMIAPNALTVMQSIVYADQINYKILEDFAPIAKLARHPLALTVPANSPIQNIADLVAWAKKNPQTAAYGISAAGGFSHFGGVMLAKTMNFEWTAIPYKGGSLLSNDLIAGHVPVGIDTLVDHIEHHRSKRLRIIAISTAKRFELNPEIPTFVEQGVKDLDLEGWFGAFVSSKVPRPVIARIEEALRLTLADPSIAKKLNAISLEADFKSATETRRALTTELQSVGLKVQEAKFKAE